MNVATPSRHCYEINLQAGLGGGEIYTKFFTHALVHLGWSVSLIAKRGSWLARTLKIPGVRVIEAGELEDVPALLGQDGDPVLSHNPFGGRVAQTIRQSHRLIFFAHMPLYGRDPEAYREADLIFAVSQHVIDSLVANGLQSFYPAPLYGVADFERGQLVSPGIITRRSPYDWDLRKFRDRLLALLYPLYEACLPRKVFSRRPGVTLGIVSRLTPIKQFPLMFQFLAPVLQHFPTVNIEIFGSGGYASVRDLRRSIAPIKHQVRFWGQQSDVRFIYSQLDYLLTGLPEKEALGLNVVEAQACGIPVLAVNAPPFTETILPGRSGFLFTDPRKDNGRDFADLLGKLVAGQGVDRLQWDTSHLEQFRPDAFEARVDEAMRFAQNSAGSRQSERLP